MRYLLITICCFCSLIANSQDKDYYAKGLEFAQKGDFENAKILFEKEAQQTPENYYAWFNLALSESRLNELKSSIEHFGQAIKLKEDFYKAYLNRALVKRDLTRYKEALEDLNKCLEINKSYSPGYYHRAIILEYLNQSDKACADIKTAKKLKQKNVDHLIKSICEDKPNNYANILYLTKQAPDKTYGYTKENPIKVGTGVRGGPGNQRAFLNLLRDGNNNTVQYKRKGSCCPYKSENGMMGSAMLDKYEVMYKENGTKKTSILYISFYDYEELMIPLGFGTVR